MSTTIYYGFKMEHYVSWEAVLMIVKDFRPWVADQQLKVYEEWVAFVNKVRNREEGHPQYYEECFWSWIEKRREIKKTGLRNPMVDTDFDAILLPYKGVLYGISFTEHASWHAEWLKQPGVSEFAYWNNTDRPDHVTDEEWDARGDLWDQILPGSGRPVMHGFTIAIGDPNGPDLYAFAEARRAAEANKT